MDIWTRIESLLSSQQKSQADLARLIDVNKSSINHWKDGVIPRADIAVKIARVLGTTVEYLVTGEDTQPADSTRNLKREILAVLSNY